MQTSEYVTNLYDVYKMKNKAYGNSAHNSFMKYGFVSYVTRISDKLNRLKTISANKDIDTFDESILDTVGDAATYMAMFFADTVDAEHYEQSIRTTFSELIGSFKDDINYDHEFDPDELIHSLDLIYKLYDEKRMDAARFEITRLLSELIFIGVSITNQLEAVDEVFV